MNKIILILLFLIIAGCQLYAAGQIDSLSNSDTLSLSAPKEISSRDSMNLFMEDSNGESASDSSLSVTTAIVLSLLVPGSGQIYYGDYWKAPLFFGGAAVLGWWAWKNNQTFQDLEAKGDTNKEIYRNNRDQSLFFLAGVYILAAVDAYVGVHLYNFNVNENLSLYLAPDENTGNLKIALNLRL